VLGEGLCTFLFLFIVMATHVNDVRSHTNDSLVLGAISTGFASIALIYSFADVSGAHFNPAVTFATVVTGKTSLAKGMFFRLSFPGKPTSFFHHQSSLIYINQCHRCFICWNSIVCCNHRHRVHSCSLPQKCSRKSFHGIPNGTNRC
jgi:hypothetical protein